ncbi:MAG TPA: hypothetical protein PLE30_11515, partial [Candidatus Kapabacteria bacterium]|nr:hypothetical protein [Candidatus Kapabacteria bacterium]
AGFADDSHLRLLGGHGSGGGGGGRSLRSIQGFGPKTYDPYNINESSSPGGKSGLDVGEIRRRTKKYSDDLIDKHYSNPNYKGIEIGYNYYYNINDGEIYAEFFQGAQHSMTLNFRSFVYKYENGYKLIAFEHIHTLNQPLEPLDFNSLGYNIQLLTTPGPNPMNPWRQFIYFCTTVAEKNNPKTTYGFIYDAKMFEKWYNAKDKNGNGVNFNGTRFRLWEINDWELNKYFLNNSYIKAFEGFGKILNNPKNNTGVIYGKIP